MARYEWYQGCKGVASEQDLDHYERQGVWVAEPKEDGEWAACTIGAPNVFVNRYGREIALADAGFHALRAWPFPTGTDAVLIGELQAATQRASTSVARLGFRQFHVFDVVRMAGKDVRSFTLSGRRELLEVLWRHLSDETKARFVLVEQRRSGFLQFYREVVEKGGEGIVLKDLRRPYGSRTADRKVDHWVKVKREMTVDMVVMGFGIGEKTREITSLVCGLYRDGRLEEVCKVGLGALHAQRHTMVLDDWLGKVVEVRGFEVFRSGAVRSGSVVRVREDKESTECVAGR